MTEVAIGQTVQASNGQKLICVRSLSGRNVCRDSYSKPCYFTYTMVNGRDHVCEFSCMAKYREDGENVVYIKAEGK